MSGQFEENQMNDQMGSHSISEGGGGGESIWAETKQFENEGWSGAGWSGLEWGWSGAGASYHNHIGHSYTITYNYTITI
jgi:hypothetical protein